MKRKRLVYCSLLLAAAAAWCFANSTGTRMVLAGVLGLPALTFLLLVCSKPAVTLRWDCPAQLERGQTASLRLTICSRSRFPLLLHGTLVAENLYTGAHVEQALQICLPRRGETVQTPALQCLHCGQLRVRFERCVFVDLLGLFQRSVSFSEAAAWSVLPRTRPVAVLWSESADFLSDADRYSTARPGNDPSETFRIRAYRPGDPIRQIHWKLSEKTDATLIRDFGLPVVSDLLILVQNEVSPARSDAADAVLDALASLAEALLEQEITWELGWIGADCSLCLRQLDEKTAWTLALEELLATPAASSGCSVCALAADCISNSVYAHVAVFSPRALPDADLLCHGNRVTVCLPPDAAAAAEDPTSVVHLFPIRPTFSEMEL